MDEFYPKLCPLPVQNGRPRWPTPSFSDIIWPTHYCTVGPIRAFVDIQLPMVTQTWISRELVVSGLEFSYPEKGFPSGFPRSDNFQCAPPSNPAPSDHYLAHPPIVPYIDRLLSDRIALKSRPHAHTQFRFCHY